MVDLRPTTALVTVNQSPLDLTAGRDLAALQCQVEASVACANGTPILLINRQGDLPPNPTSPAIGGTVSPGEQVQVRGNSGVVVNGGASATITAPECQVSASIACQTTNGVPTGRAVLSVEQPTDLPANTAIDPSAGTTVESEGQLTATVNNGVHFVSSASPSLTLVAPPCIVSATATAVCANGGIEIAVTTDGAPASAVTIDGELFALNNQPPPPPEPPVVANFASSQRATSVIVIAGVAPAADYLVAAVPIDPTVAAEPAVVPLMSRCSIEVSAVVQCVSEQAVLIQTTIGSSTTGTVARISIDGDSNLPLTVVPGSSPVLSVTSPDTLPEDISVPTLTVPASCDNRGTPLAGTLTLTSLPDASRPTSYKSMSQPKALRGSLPCRLTVIRQCPTKSHRRHRS